MAAAESGIAQRDECSDMHLLICAVQNGDKKAESRLLHLNNGLIWSIVRRFIPRAAPRGIEPEDLYQLGSIGFIKAVRNFDLSRTLLSTYAVPKIIGEIKRFLRDDGLIKISRAAKEAANKLTAAREKFVNAKGIEPTIQELSEITGMPPEDIVIADEAIIAFDSVMGGRAPEDGGRDIEDYAGASEIECGIVDKLRFPRAISKLDIREKAVISLRYRRSLTQQKTAEILGISQVQVSRIESKTLARLRELIGERY